MALPSGALAQADPRPDGDDDPGAPPPPPPRGSLLCTGHNGSYLGFAEVDDEGEWSGFDIEMCKALATAILGSPDALQIIPVSWAQRFPALQSGDIDVIIKVHRLDDEPRHRAWPAILAALLHRADEHSRAHRDRRDLARRPRGRGVLHQRRPPRSNASWPTTWARAGISYEPLNFDNPEELRAALYAGRCDALGRFRGRSSPRRASTRLTPEDFTILDAVLALEPEGIAAREGDDGFIDVINWMMSALLMAEEAGITQANVDEVRADPAVGFRRAASGRQPRCRRASRSQRRTGPTP